MGGDKRSMQFYYALHKRHIHKVKHMVLNEGVSVNHMFADGTFPVHVAAERGDVEILKFLLSMKASPDLKTRHGQTALMLGITFIDIVRQLINFGCKVNLTDDQRRTALHLAGARGLHQTVALLLAADGRAVVQDKWGRTPLHVTLLNVSHNAPAIRDYQRVVRVLINHGADVNSPDRHRSTPLFLAANCGCEEIVAVLMSAGARVDQLSRHQLTPLMLAALKGHEKIVVTLLLHNSNTNIIHKETGKFPFQIAVEKGHLKIARDLVAAGCSYLKIAFNLTVTPPRTCTEEMKNWLTDLAKTPPSLRSFCRSQIRASLGHSIDRKLKRFEYPQILKDFLLLKDLEFSAKIAV